MFVKNIGNMSNIYPYSENQTTLKTGCLLFNNAAQNVLQIGEVLTGRICDVLIIAFVLNRTSIMCLLFKRASSFYFERNDCVVSLSAI